MIAVSAVLEDTNPFKRVLGFATLLAEDGKAMHKSTGNSIEFNEGADDIGVDVMRWAYIRHKPSENLLFGYTKTNEVRRQFKEMPGILDGTQTPDYAQCVKISTDAALKEMILPAILAIVTPLSFGYIFGAEVLGGLLAGTLATGIMLAIFMANAGGAWDNAKKLIETGEFGGKGSDAHKAAITGDTVGDPFKDTAGPSIDILIKLMTTISLVFAAAFGMGLI